MSYYEKEIEKLGAVEVQEHPLKIQIVSEDGKTKWLDLNRESIPAVVALLKRINKGAI